MQVVEFYKVVFQENLKLIFDFLNSTENDNFDLEKKYEKVKKSKRLS